MNPVDRFNCVLRYSSLPQELQAQVRLPWLASVLEWHALRDPALVLVDIRDNASLVVSDRATLPIAVISTCDKVKMFALFFFSRCLRLAFWVCNSRLQLQQNPPANADEPAAPVQPLDLNGLVNDVFNRRITREEALALIEERVPEEQRRDFRANFLAVFSDGPFVQIDHTPSASKRLADESTFLAIITRLFVEGAVVPGADKADRLLAELPESDRNQALDEFYAEVTKSGDAYIRLQNAEYALGLFIDGWPEKKRQIFVRDWMERHPQGDLAGLGEYFRVTSSSLEVMQSCQRIVEETNLDEICLEEGRFEFLNTYIGETAIDETAREFLHNHFVFQYQTNKNCLMSELLKVIDEKEIGELKGMEELLSCYRDKFIPLTAIRRSLKFLREDREPFVIERHVQAQLKFVQSKYLEGR